MQKKKIETIFVFETTRASSDTFVKQRVNEVLRARSCRLVSGILETDAGRNEACLDRRKGTSMAV